ncbi:hypothetical protein GCM10009774_25780 [Cellulomonas gelida]|uniref:Uncharacterized protein n=2 Tax=Cellulomonas gelida TaxID=1712 RepID=A0A4Y3KEC9_9CELL|nr:hypothetical protein CGE01nite_00420 [Cellulomonas gelida]GGL34083.1 hypothetical protein GCM10009774_25780 [Cellulomonas gelida]
MRLPIAHLSAVAFGAAARVGGDGEFTVCSAPVMDGPRALGSAFATNTGSHDITITAVEPVDVAGFDVGPAYAILENSSGNWYAVGGAIPPADDDATSQLAWDRRVDVEDVVIAPGETWQIIQSMRITSLDDAHVKALKITYTEDGSERVAQNTTQVGVEGHGPPCR